jgi:hypothetical protein
MRTRSLLTLGRVQDYETTGPVILPSNFLRKETETRDVLCKAKLLLKVPSTSTFASYELHVRFIFPALHYDSV